MTIEMVERAAVASAISSRYMNRAETAEYVTANHFPIGQQTLAKYAVMGGGPPYRKAGRRPIYDTNSVDDWARARISPLVRSTSEFRAITEAA